MFGFRDFSAIWNEECSLSSSIKSLEITIAFNNDNLKEFIKNCNYIQQLTLRNNWNKYINNISTSIKSLHLLDSFNLESLEHLTFIQKLEIEIPDKQYKVEEELKEITNSLFSLSSNITELSILNNTYFNSSKFILKYLFFIFYFRSNFIKIIINIYFKTFNFWY